MKSILIIAIICAPASFYLVGSCMILGLIKDTSIVEGLSGMMLGLLVGIGAAAYLRWAIFGLT